MTRASFLLDDGQVVGLESARGDDPRILRFESGHPDQRWILGAGSGDPSPCAHCSKTWQPGPALIVTTPAGEVAGAARICTCRNGEIHGHLALTIAGPFEHSGLGPLLLRELFDEARDAGFERVYACFLYRHHDAIRDCQDAGFRVESVLSGGSISEVVLRVAGAFAPSAPQ